MKQEIIITAASQSKTKGKILNENCYLNFPLKCTLYKKSGKYELHFDKTDYYTFKLKKAFENIQLKANITNLTKNQLSKFSEVKTR